MDSLNERVKRVMAVVFNTRSETIGDDAGLMATRGWDSLGHAQLMAALEEEFSVDLPTDVVIELQSLREIVEYLAQRTSPLTP